MKPEAERAIRTIDELIAWLAKKQIIKNQAAIDRLSAALRIIADNCEQENATYDAEMNAIAERANKLKLLLRACDFTEKGIEEAAKFDTEYLIEFVHQHDKNENSLPINHPMGFNFLKCHERWIRVLAECEIDENLKKQYPKASKEAFIYSYYNILKNYQWS